MHVSAGKNHFLLLCSQSGTKLLLPVCWPEAEIKDCTIQVFPMRMVALRRSTLFSDAGVHRSATGIFTFEPTVLFCDPTGHKSSLRPLCPSFILFTRNATTHNVWSAYSYRHTPVDGVYPIYTVLPGGKFSGRRLVVWHFMRTRTRKFDLKMYILANCWWLMGGLFVVCSRQLH